SRKCATRRSRTTTPLSRNSGVTPPRKTDPWEEAAEVIEIIIATMRNRPADSVSAIHQLRCHAVTVGVGNAGSALAEGFVEAWLSSAGIWSALECASSSLRTRRTPDTWVIVRITR